MNWLLKRLGYRNRHYCGEGFSVRIEPMGREALYVNYKRADTKYSLDGQYIGRGWGGVEVWVPLDIDSVEAQRITQDLKAAFEPMSYGYIIVRQTGVEIVAEPERRAAMEELRSIGWKIEILKDGKIRQTWRQGAPRQDFKTIRKTAPRIMTLLHTIRGRRERFEILAKSKEF
jgi:hypothetical protein